MNIQCPEIAYPGKQCTRKAGHDGCHEFRASPESVPQNEYDSPRNWLEDFGQENGQYVNRCTDCRKVFVGHKRRATCKLCATPLPAKEETPRNIECCAQCGEPKNNPNQQAGDEVAQGWPSCENPSCVAFGQPTASAWYRPASLSSASEITEAIRRLTFFANAENRVEAMQLGSRLEQLYREQQREIYRLRRDTIAAEEAEHRTAAALSSLKRENERLGDACDINDDEATALQRENASLKDNALTPEEAAELLWGLEGGVHQLFTEDQMDALVEKLICISGTSPKSDTK